MIHQVQEFTYKAAPALKMGIHFESRKHWTAGPASFKYAPRFGGKGMQKQQSKNIGWSTEFLGQTFPTTACPH
jgi:hypothetical protein